MTDAQLILILAIGLSLVTTALWSVYDWLMGRKYYQYLGFLANNGWKLLLVWVGSSVALWLMLYIPYYLTYYAR